MGGDLMVVQAPGSVTHNGILDGFIERVEAPVLVRTPSASAPPSRHSDVAL